MAFIIPALFFILLIPAIPYALSTPTPTVTPVSERYTIELQSGTNGYQGGHSIGISDYSNGLRIYAGGDTVLVTNPAGLNNNEYHLTPIFTFDLPFEINLSTTIHIDLTLWISDVSDPGEVRFVMLNESYYLDIDYLHRGENPPPVNQFIPTWFYSNYNITSWNDPGAGIFILGDSADKQVLETVQLNSNSTSYTFSGEAKVNKNTKKLAFAIMSSLDGIVTSFFTEHTYEVGKQPLLRLHLDNFDIVLPVAPTPTPAEIPIAYSGFYWLQSPVNGNYYTYVVRPFYWDEAKIFSESIGAHLVTITSEEENQWILDTFGYVGWIGLRTDTGWVTGEEVDYTRWAPHEPSGDGVYVNQGDFKAGWNDRPNNEPAAAIVEFEGDIPFPSPTITPTPLRELHQSIDFDSMHIVSNPPTGYLNGTVNIGNVLDSDSSDGIGIKVDLNPGQGVLLFSLMPIESPGMMKINSRIKTSNSEPSVALIALNSTLDGQFSFINLSSNALPVNDYQNIQLYYQPPDGQMLLGIQAVNSPFSSVSTSVLVDDIAAQLYNPSNHNRVETQVDGAFERGFINLIENFNRATGRVVPIFNSFTDIAIQLAVSPDDNAANIGIMVTDSSRLFPNNLFGNVKIQRDDATTDGMFAMVITNGIQNFTLFRNVAEISSSGMETLTGGASFFSNNPSIPVVLVVQNSGWGFDSTVIVDDLFLYSQ